MSERLEKIWRIIDGLQREIQSPHDSSIEDALKLIYDEIKERHDRHSYGPEVKS